MQKFRKKDLIIVDVIFEKCTYLNFIDVADVALIWALIMVMESAGSVKTYVLYV